MGIKKITVDVYQDENLVCLQVSYHNGDFTSKSLTLEQFAQCIESAQTVDDLKQDDSDQYEEDLSQIESDEGDGYPPDGDYEPYWDDEY